MKLLCGVILLVGAEQAFAHAMLIEFPNHDAASGILIPASLCFLILGGILTVWGLLTETRTRQIAEHPKRAANEE